MTDGGMGMIQDPEKIRYQARVWRTEKLRDEAALEVQIILEAFLPPGYVIEIREQPTPAPGFPYSQPYKFYGIVKDGRENGSDAHFCAFGKNRDAVRARLLAIILEGGGFFPLT